MGYSMEAGRELDALVAEKVMGHKVTWDRWCRILDDPKPTDPMEPFFGDTNIRVSTYSSNIEYAWAVVERMRADGYGFYMELCKDVWFAYFDKDNTFNELIKGGEHATAPLAICASALAALAPAAAEGGR
jgi:hypothetical protein